MVKPNTKMPPFVRKAMKKRRQSPNFHPNAKPGQIVAKAKGGSIRRRGTVKSKNGKIRYRVRYKPR